MRKLTHEELLRLRLDQAALENVKRYPLTIVLEDVRSSYNVGSIFRTADAFRIHQLILTGYTPSPPSTEISKTALGAVETVPHLHVPSAPAAIHELKSAGWNVFALELAEPALRMDTLNADLFPLALVLGNELTGVRAETLEHCQGAMYIPMHGVKHSLNVAVAAGIAMYEAIRQMP